MASFTNIATLSYNGNQVNSNVVSGEILEVLAVNKTAIPTTYTQGDTVTYVINLINSSGTALTDLTLSDNLGGYTFETGTVYPLQYVEGSARYFADGAVQTAPTVTAGPPLVFTGINVPANGTASIVYQAIVTNYASPAEDGAVNNTVTVTGSGLTAAQTATAQLTAEQTARLDITKSLSPAVVAENGQLTYTFTIRNFGPTALETSDNASVTDTFNPLLRDISVSYNGAAWQAPADYTYDTATGVFSTVPGRITVPAATYTRNIDGTWNITPGTAVITVTGTI